MLAITQFEIVRKIHRTIEESKETFELKQEEVQAINSLFLEMGLTYQFDQVTKLQTDHAGEQWVGHTTQGRIVNLTQFLSVMYARFEALAEI